MCFYRHKKYIIYLCQFIYNFAHFFAIFICKSHLRTPKTHLRTLKLALNCPKPAHCRRYREIKRTEGVSTTDIVGRMLDVDTGTAHHVGGIPAEGSEMQRRYSEISESGCVWLREWQWLGGSAWAVLGRSLRSF
jgi:hypothetical protein